MSKAEKKSGIMRDAIILFIIALVLSAILGIVYSITKDTIAARNVQTKNEAYEAVFTELDGEITEDADLTAALEESAEVLAQSPNELVASGNTINDIRVATDSSGEVAGYAVDVTNSTGYGGDINIAVGISVDDTITGISIISQSETAGLGANCTKTDFTDQFVGLSASDDVSYSKTGASAENNEVDAISSATFTTRAVVEAVNAAAYYVNNAVME